MKLEYLQDIERIKIYPENTTELRGIKNYLNRHVDGYMFDIMFKNKIWDGKRTQYHKETDTIPLGLWKETLKCCQEFGYNWNFLNKDQFPLNRDVKKDEFYSFVNDFFKDYKFQPRDYQIRVAWNIIKNRYCNVAVATSGGKTLIYSMVMFFLMNKYPNEKFLLVVPSKTLVTQFYDDVIGFNYKDQININAKEIFAEGEKPRIQDPTKEPNFVIATFQSLTYEEKVENTNPKIKAKTKVILKYPKEWFKQFWSVTVDEAHRGKSESYSKKILKYTQNNAIYRWGMSGSYPDESTHEMAEIMAKTGPIVDVVKAKELMDSGFITKVKIKGILMKHNDYEFTDTLEIVSSRDKKAAYDLETSRIQESEERLKVINQIISKCTSNTLVLFHNTEYGQKILEYVKELNPDKEFFYIDGSVKNNGSKKNIENNRTYIKSEMEKTKQKIEFTILNFGDYELEIKSNTEILLTNGTYKSASNIDENDDIDDAFLNQLRIDINASSKS